MDVSTDLEEGVGPDIPRVRTALWGTDLHLQWPCRPQEMGTH